MNFIYYFFMICETSWLQRAPTQVWEEAEVERMRMEMGMGIPLGCPGVRRKHVQGGEAVHTPGGAEPRCSEGLCCLWSQRNYEGETAQLIAKGDTPRPNPKLGFFLPPGACWPLRGSCPLPQKCEASPNPGPAILLWTWSLTWACA